MNILEKHLRDYLELRRALGFDLGRVESLPSVGGGFYGSGRQGPHHQCAGGDPRREEGL